MTQYKLETQFQDGREGWEFRTIPWKAEIININVEERILDAGMRMSITYLTDKALKDLSIRKYIVLQKNAEYEGSESLKFVQRIIGSRAEVWYVFQVGNEKIIKADVPKEDKVKEK